MPGLILFKRRWAIGSDDFVFSSLGEIVLRIAWLTALAVIFDVHHNGFNCDHGTQLKAFYIGALVLNSIAIIILIALTRISMQGTITDSWPRRNISRWLYVKLLLLFFEAIWVFISTYWAFGHSYTCEWTVIWTARGAVICSWIVGFIMFVIILIIIDPMGDEKRRRSIVCSMSQGGDSELTMASLSSSQVWETRCRVLCCCVACNPDTRQAFIEISRVMAEFFHDVDLVVTDIAAGLILVHEQQVDIESQLYSQATDDYPGARIPTQSDSVDTFPVPKSWMTISNMVHYMKYAEGSYGWPFYIYENMATGVCRLCPHCRFCACIRSPHGVTGDNCCHCNTATIKKLAGICDNDLIYVTFNNKFKQIPFFVVVDRETNSVVISIRGTLSFHDALADLSAVGATLDIPGVENSYCHAAMLDCANYIKSELQALRILDTAFAQLQTEGNLVITGHSLGAGVAAILAVLLRPQYPQVICFSFSPPGGLMSVNASRYTQDFVCSVVVGKDLVPRLGMYTLTDLKVKILRALCQSSEPKYKILATGCFRLLCCINLTGNMASVTRDDARQRYAEEERICILQNTLRNAEVHLEQTVRSSWPLHPAGQILHVVELGENRSLCGSEPVYGAFWSRAEVFNKIVISNKMVSDHIPNVVYWALEQLYQRSYVPQFMPAVQQHC